MGFENLLLGFSIAITPFNLFVALVGITLGTVIGVLPGLGGANGVAILLPLTFTMPPTSAIILLTSIYWGALFGGAITSVLFNIPGAARSLVTICCATSMWGPTLLSPTQHPRGPRLGSPHLRRLSAGPAGAGGPGPDR